MPTPDELMKRFEDMTAAEDEKLDEKLPPGAREREAVAQEKAMAVYEAARAMLTDGMIEAAGYRILIKPIEAIVELEAAEASVAPTLHEAGFQVKTAAQKDREERGENHGIVINLGPMAFKNLGGAENWCKEGDTIVFNRYAGTRVEHPPGSGVFYQIMNDEDVFGVIK